MALTKSQLWIQIHQKQRDLDAFASRRNKLRIVQQSLVADFDNNVRDIEKKRGRAQADFSKGLSGAGLTKVSTMQAKMNNTAQPLPANDADIIDARQRIQSEIDRCQGNINALNTQIIQLQNQYNNAP